MTNEELAKEVRIKKEMEDTQREGIKRMIFMELQHVKNGEIYLGHYLSFQKRVKRLFQILTLVLSLSGILSWKYFENIVWVPLLIISVIQIASLVESPLLRSDKEIEQIAQLKILYTSYFSRIEKLWTNFYFNIIESDSAADRFYNLREKDWRRIEKLEGEVNVYSKWKKMVEKSRIETHAYINQYHKR